MLRSTRPLLARCTSAAETGLRRWQPMHRLDIGESRGMVLVERWQRLRRERSVAYAGGADHCNTRRSHRPFSNIGIAWRRRHCNSDGECRCRSEARAEVGCWEGPVVDDEVARGSWPGAPYGPAPISVAINRSCLRLDDGRLASSLAVTAALGGPHPVGRFWFTWPQRTSPGRRARHRACWTD